MKSSTSSSDFVSVFPGQITSLGLVGDEGWQAAADLVPNSNLVRRLADCGEADDHATAAIAIG